MFFCNFCKIFKSTFFTEPLPVTTSSSSGRYLKQIKMTSIEAILETLDDNAEHSM